MNSGGLCHFEATVQTTKCQESGEVSAVTQVQTGHGHFMNSSVFKCVI